MTFQQPLFLLLLLAVPLGLVGWLALRRARPPAGVPFPDLDLVSEAAPPPRRRRYVPIALVTLAAMLLTVALARPEIWRDEPRERATIMLAIDVSGSMAATDVEPFRLRAAQDAARQFADTVPRQYQVGLVSFSGTATVLVPPTTDRLALERAIDSLVPDGATAIGDAVVQSLDAIETVQQPDESGQFEAARILLLSDGASTTGTLVSTAAGEAQRSGVPVFTVALGTDAGILPNGQRVPPDIDGLKRLADDTGGDAFESRDAESVAAVYDRLGSFIGTERARSEITAWPAGLAAALLVLAGLGAWRWGPKLG